MRQQDDAPLVPPDAPASAAQHAEVPPVAGADREPAADFVGSAAARIVQLERRARGRGRREGRGRGGGRRASPAARVDDTPVEDEQSVPHVSTASQRRVLSQQHSSGEVKELPARNAESAELASATSWSPARNAVRKVLRICTGTLCNLGFLMARGRFEVVEVTGSGDPCECWLPGSLFCGVQAVALASYRPLSKAG